ncbi:MAG TPA: alpha/beta hydrolase [Steroidobacter sp.]|uniref:alpha/beta fold hydrolase n=1 Tax=Steroidobacter sp. TaxID=1978227 RepID=UPI002ED98EA8
MNDRRSFIKLGCATSALAATGWSGQVSAKSRERCAPDFDGIMGRGYARGPYGLVHFHDSVGLVKSPRNPRPLVLLHQSPASARQFEAAFKPLVNRGVRFVAIDTPGFGFSDPPPAIPRVEDWARSVVSVLDHLGIEQADILGHHTGGLIATEVALNAPSRVRRLILNGPFPITEEERQKYIESGARSHERGRPKLDGSHLATSFEARKRMYGPDPDPAVITRIVVEKYQGRGPYWWGHHVAYRYDHAATLKRLKHRTLILTNTGDDIYEHAKRAKEMRPDFEYVELIGGTHDIVDQQPEEWSEAVAAFITRPD